MSSTDSENPGLTTMKAGKPDPRWEEIIPLLFDCTTDKGAQFYPLLVQEEFVEVRDLSDMGAMGPEGIVNMFGSAASQFRVHFAIIVTFADFIEKHVSGVMELGRDPCDEAWVLTVRRNFKNAEFKIYRKRMWKDSLNLMEMYLPPSASMPALTPVLSKSQNIPYPNSKVNQAPCPPRPPRQWPRLPGPPPWPPQQAPPPLSNPAALYEPLTKEETHVDKVFRKHSFQEVGETCKPLKIDKKIPNHALKCHAQLAIPRTFSDLVGMLARPRMVLWSRLDY